MSIKIKNLTVKNFMSVGNATQGINFDRRDLTLVLGENLDLGGDDSGARNGTGKTTIVNALSYAFYGQALTNIRKDNLINKTNSKSMLVTIEFDKDGQPYRIERGRKPNITMLYVGDKAIETQDSDSQGDSRETQAEIEKIVGMSHDMFRHVVALNTYTEPFLSLKANEQRLIIEQLLGITLLSEKADLLKELIRSTKEGISAEEARVKAVGDANKRIEEQIVSLKRRQKLWTEKYSADLSGLRDGLQHLLQLDIEKELRDHVALAEQTAKIAAQVQAKAEYKKAVAEIEKEIARMNKLKAEIAQLEDHKCHSCGQELHDEKHAELLIRKQTDLEDIGEHIGGLQMGAILLDSGIDSEFVPKQITTFYDDIKDAYNHKTSIEHIQQQVATKEKEEDPYAEQVAEMSEKGIVEVSYDQINELTSLKEHQEFLLKLLTNKDSFIRKQIIDQNLSYLNKRLGFYLEKIGLPHEVVFQNDLTVSISELGRDLDFDNLSRGERNRLILSLSWAFRDVWESLYHPVNLLFVDELIDNGLDTSGVEAALAILKKMARDANKSVWLVSHKDELAGRVNNILSVVKENGFTSYGTETESV